LNRECKCRNKIWNAQIFGRISQKIVDHPPWWAPLHPANRPPELTNGGCLKIARPTKINSRRENYDPTEN